MPYATRATMESRYGLAELVALTDLQRTGTVDDAVLSAAIDRASGVVDGYLLGRVAVPLATVPAVIQLHTESICRRLLQTVSVDEAAQADYDAAIRYLERVAAGQVPLLPPESAPAPAGAGPVLFSPGDKVFGREQASGCARCFSASAAFHSGRGD